MVSAGGNSCVTIASFGFSGGRRTSNKMAPITAAVKLTFATTRRINQGRAMNARRNWALGRLRAFRRDACWACAGGHRLVVAYSVDRLRVGASKLRGGWLCGRAHRIDRARAGTDLVFNAA